MTQMLQMSKNSNIKKVSTAISRSDLATRQMQAYYVAADYTIKTQKNIQTMATFT